MKRRVPLQRRTPIKRSSVLPKLNVARAKRQREKYQVYLRSPEWREKKRRVAERSGGRCEAVMVAEGFDSPLPSIRCWNRATIVNHRTYQRFGHERLEDLEHLCKPHEREYENARPWRQARRQALTRLGA
jgi:hypothetical protein